jgi:hypothetical protein
VPEVQSRVEPLGQSPEPRARSSVSLVPESDPGASLHAVGPLGACGVSTGWLRLLAFIHVALRYSNFCCCLLILGFHATNAGALVVSVCARGDDRVLLGCLEHVSYTKAVLNLLQ